MAGCNNLDRLLNGEPRKPSPYDTTPTVETLTGVTSFDFDSVYNVPTVSLVRVKRPTDSDYWSLNVYEYNYDATARVLHFGKLVAVSGDGLTVESQPAAPVGTLYEIVVS